MDEIQTKVLRVILLAVHSQLYSFALRFLFLQAHATSYSFYSQLLYFVKEKGGKPDGKLYPLPYGIRHSYRYLNFENSQDYVQKPQRNCTFMNSASVHLTCRCSSSWCIALKLLKIQEICRVKSMGENRQHRPFDL